MQANTSPGGGGTEDQRLEELRLALVLNGGVSLAVWMGGVSFELNRLVRETHPVYQGLLRLTKTAARIDVISGTSAGGINGAALALAQIHDKSLYSLRDVWLDIGGLEHLLHEPDDDDLNSLLRGNDWFLPKIQQAFGALVSKDPAPASQVPMLLNLTTTLLEGQSHNRLDDFGADIEDIVHRASWRFERLGDAPAVPDDPFMCEQIVEQLAFAARSSASFPVAFEPAQYNPKDSLFVDSHAFKIEGREPRNKIRRLLLDGGILDNQPFEAALEGIAKLPASGDTRRVLAYIVPDPAVAAEVRDESGGDESPTAPGAAGTASDPANAGKLPQPSLAEVAWRSLVGIPMSQSIGSHMDKLKRHNAEANGRWQRIVSVVGHVSPDQLVAQAGVMMPAYRARRIDGMIDYLLDEIEHGLSITGNSGTSGNSGASGASGANAGKSTEMRRSTRRWLRSVWQQAIASPATPAPAPVPPPAPTPPTPAGAATRQVADLLAGRIPDDYDPSKPLVTNGQWPWGLFGLEFLSDMTLELLRRTQRLHAFVPRWEEDLTAAAARGAAKAPATASSTTPAALEPEVVLGRVDWEARDEGRSQVGTHLRQDGTRVGDAILKPIWQEAYAIARHVHEQRGVAKTEAQEAGAKAFKKLVDDWRESDLNNQTTPAKLERQAIGVMDALLPGPDQATDLADNAKNASRLCELIDKLRGPMVRILQCFAQKSAANANATAGAASAFSMQSRADVQTAVDELRALYAFFFGALGNDPASRADFIAWRAMALEVFEFTAGARMDGPDSQAEVVQISARQPSIWEGSRDPAAKLNGMQLAHFGAFYKRSWRANDWTFGRLDGIDRAVRIALNPDSLQRRYGARRVKVPGEAEPVPASAYVRAYLHNLAVKSAEHDLAIWLGMKWAIDEPAITKELEWLDQDATVPPPVLEYCARALTRRLQLEALRVELPEIATSLRFEEKSGAPPSSAGQLLLAEIAQGAVPSVRAIETLMKKNLIGSDSMEKQAGTDLFTRTASQGLSTAHAALSKNGGLHAINIVLKITDWPLRILYLLTNRLMQGGRTSAAVQGLVLGVGLALVVAGALADKLPAPLLSLGWALLAGVIAKALLLNLPKMPERVAELAAWLVVPAVLLLLGVFHVLPVAFAVACGVLGALALQSRLTSVSTCAIVLAIAAWTVHAGIDDWETKLRTGLVVDVDRVSGVTEQQCAKGANPPPALDAAHLKTACEHREAAERIDLVQWPVLGLVAALLLAAFRRQVDRWWRSRHPA